MKVGIPKGMRDFSPKVMAKRNYIFDTIKEAFLLSGFEQIETPTMENLETLTGKYGEEGDRLIFKVLKRGDKLKSGFTSKEELKEKDLADGALRYDLTVPFARYVVQHQNDIAFPFKRFQIQPVWRADRPQKGRYREFYQCDADIIGSDSLLNEVELIKLFDDVLTKLGMRDFSIKLNNRKVLTGIAEIIGKPEMIVPITVAIDKLEKIGVEKVKAELAEKGLTEAELDIIEPLFQMSGSNESVLEQLSSFLSDSEIGQQGIAEINFVLNAISQSKLKKGKLEVDVTLARGLDYYTGSIFEVVSNELSMGSICGGGRYADLTGIFGLKNMSGVGISFGADRIYDVMEELQLFPQSLEVGTQVLFINFGEKEANYILPYLQQLREKGISAILYPDTAKMNKQMKYANQKQIGYVVIVGESEMQDGTFSLKDMTSGEQCKVNFNELVEHINS